MPADRFYLDRDGSAHWYVVPVDRSEEWEEWLALDEDDQRSWTPPAFAKVVGAAPTLVSFENWRVD